MYKVPESQTKIQMYSTLQEIKPIKFCHILTAAYV